MIQARHLCVVAILWLVLLPACQSAPNTAVLGYKFLIYADGFYRVTGAALQAAGVDLGPIDPSTFQLFREDREIAIRVKGTGKDLIIDFYGQASRSPYSAFNVYRLVWGDEKGKRIQDTAPEPGSGAPQDSFQDTVRFARPTLFAPQPGDPSRSWFWQSLTAPMTTSITVTLPSAIASQAQLDVNLWAISQDAASPDHHLGVFFNDTRVADESWDGQGPRTLRGAIPPSAVHPGTNTVKLVAPGDTKAAADVVLFSSAQVTYTRQLVAQADTLAFRGSAGTYRVEGFTSDAIDLFDVTVPEEPRLISNARTGSRAVEFSAGEAGPHNWVALSSSAYQPARRVPMPASAVAERVRQADYVIITHPDLADALQPLVDWRIKHGLKVAVATTTEIYDNYAYGVESPQSIGKFLSSIRPRFVLLVGKASYDYRDYMNGPNKNMVPTFLVETPHLSQAASDNWYAATSPTDPHPTFAIGRIPAKTKEQVAGVVSKIIAYESAPRDADWRRRAIFVADDKDPTFESFSDSLAAQLAPTLTPDKVYLGTQKGNVDATRQELMPRWNSGALLLTYVGHGSVDTWAEGPLFSAEDVGSLKNGDRLPVLFTPTCLDGFFYHPQKDSLAEELLFKDGGGIVAGIVPTGLSVPDAQKELMQGLFAELFENSTPSLGEALARAKQKMATDTPEMREVIDTFGLLGDPALEIRNR